MPTTIGSLIAGTNLDCTGMGWQNHLVYAPNDAAWWLFYTTSADLTHVRCYRSPDGANWSVKNASNAMAGIGGTAGNVTNLADNINGRGRSLACAYKAIAGNDIVHLLCS